MPVGGAAGPLLAAAGVAARLRCSEPPPLLAAWARQLPAALGLARRTLMWQLRGASSSRRHSSIRGVGSCQGQRTSASTARVQAARGPVRRGSRVVLASAAPSTWLPRSGPSCIHVMSHAWTYALSAACDVTVSSSGLASPQTILNRDSRIATRVPEQLG